MVVVAGEAIGLATLIALSPVAGLHVYTIVDVPVAVVESGTSVPEQTDTPPPVMITVGFAPVIPVNTDGSPVARMAPAAVREPLRAVNFFQPLVT